MRRGVSFLEIVIVILIAAGVLVPMIVSLTSSTASADNTNRRALAIVLTNTCMERFRSTPFPVLAHLFEPGTDRARRALEREPTLNSDLVGEAFYESVKDFHMEGSFEQKVPERVGVLTFTCRFPSRRDGPLVSVKISKVVPNFIRLGWGKS